MDLELLDLLRFRLNTDLDTVIAPRNAIKMFIDGGAGGGGTASLFSDESLVTDSVDVSVDRSIDASVDIAEGEDAPIIRLVHRIISEAVRNRASDIHVEPMADRVLLRYRIDGVCHDPRQPPEAHAVGAARPAEADGRREHRRAAHPQDGRIKMPVDGEQIDFRVSRCPAYHGESVVLRILRPESVKIGLVNLGFEQDSLDDVQPHHPQAERHLPGDRADRLGQDDDALLGARRAQPPRPQDHHGRGSGRVQLHRHQPVPGARGHRPDVRVRSSVRCCARRRTSS